MEIGSKEFIQIMNVNFNLTIVETLLGKGIKMDPYSAFIYSSVTGAGYLDDPSYPFTPKGLLKLFYNAMAYNFVTGLFDNTTLKNTPYNLSLIKKFLFNGDKIIIPVEFNSEHELRKKLEQFSAKVKNPTDFIIQRVESSKKGNGMEPLMEYLICEAMKNEDYIVENQIPLSHSSGSPDFGGYKITDFLNSKIHLNKIHLIELSMIRLGLKKNNDKPLEKIDSLIVGEAKANASTMVQQLEKYLKTELYNEAFELHPSKCQASKPDFNLFTIDNSYKLKIIQRTSKTQFVDRKKQKEYQNWLLNYTKYYLIANLTNDEFNEFYLEINKKKISSLADIVTFVNNLSYEQILKKIKEVSNGIIE